MRRSEPLACAENLAIAGLVPLSTCDWPGRLVATVFLQGCPWHCTYCHNPGLIDPRSPGQVGWPEVTGLLGRRVGLLDGVVFSGGEPTRQPALLDAVRVVRAAGFGVGLHTGGAYPRRLAALLPYVDWVGLDIKAPPARYAAVTGVAASARTAFESLDLVLAAGVDVQVRTTVDPAVLGPDDLDDLAALLLRRGVRDHVLQTMRSEGVLLAESRPLGPLLAAAGAVPGSEEHVRDGALREVGHMSETTETLCHWEQVQRRWKWEWASYHPHALVFWTADNEDGTSELLDDATLSPEAPELKVDLCYGSRWEKVSGTGTNVVVAAVDLPEGESPVGEGWRLAETVAR